MKTFFTTLTAFLAFVALANAFTVSYDGYAVYRVDVTSPEQLESLVALAKAEASADFWTEPRLGSVDVMVGPEVQEAFQARLRSNTLSFSTMIPNVGTLIKSEAMDQQKALKNNPKAGEEMTWDAYHDLDTFYSYFDQVAANNPDVSVEKIGESYEGREMRVLKICRGGTCGNKPAMWIDGGIHAREWISPATVMWLAKQLTEDLTEANDDLVANIDWYLLPSANPDGYAYSQTNDRLWRRTRSVNGDNLCIGVDANRNWGYQWNTGGSSDNSCTQTYHGPEAFSEVENRNIRDFLTGVKDQLKFYNNVHSYSQYILLPWGFTEEPIPEYDEIVKVMDTANRELFATHGKIYDLGCIPCLLYVASGGSIDWTLGELGVKYSISMELRDTGTFGFLLPPAQIIPTGEEIFAFHASIGRQIIEEYKL